jgi:hypothetical protein
VRFNDLTEMIMRIPLFWDVLLVVSQQHAATAFQICQATWHEHPEEVYLDAVNEASI